MKKLLLLVMILLTACQVEPSLEQNENKSIEKVKLVQAITKAASQIERSESIKVASASLSRKELLITLELLVTNSLPKEDVEILLLQFENRIYDNLRKEKFDEGLLNVFDLEVTVRQANKGVLLHGIKPKQQHLINWK